MSAAPARYCLTPLGRELVEQNMPLALSVLRTSPIGRTLDPDDRRQAAYGGLIAAVVGFDDRRGIKFGTYATYMIRNAILNAAKESYLIWIPAHLHGPAARKRKKGLVDQADRVRCMLSIDEKQWQSDIEERRDGSIDARQMELLEHCISRLPDRLRSIIRDRLEDRPLREIGRARGTTHERVRQLEKIAHRLLRVDMAQLEL